MPGIEAAKRVPLHGMVYYFNYHLYVPQGACVEYSLRRHGPLSWTLWRRSDGRYCGNVRHCWSRIDPDTWGMIARQRDGLHVDSVDHVRDTEVLILTLIDLDKDKDKEVTA